VCPEIPAHQPRTHTYRPTDIDTGTDIHTDRETGTDIHTNIEIATDRDIDTDTDATNMHTLYV